MMIEALNQKGYNGFAVSIPSYKELLQIFMLAGPVFVTMMSKVFDVLLLILVPFSSLDELFILQTLNL